VRVVDEEQEDVAIGRIERRRVAADVDIGIIVHVRPVEHAWNLPPGLPDAISGDLHHRSDEFVIEDPAIVGTGGSAQFGPSIVGLVEFDLFGPVRDEPVLKVDPRERRGQFAQIGCGCADQAAKLAERPVGWSNGSFLAGDDEREAFGPVAARLDADFLAIDDACGGAVGAGTNGRVKLGQRKIALIVGAREPFGRYAPDISAAGDIDAIGA